MKKWTALKKFRLGDIFNHQLTMDLVALIGLSILLSLLVMLGFLMGASYEKNQNRQMLSPIPECPLPTPSPAKLRQTHRSGEASFYDETYCERFNPNCITASGDRFDENAFTCACVNDYPLGTLLVVSHQKKSIVVECNDRGSFKEKYGRMLDLSKAAFEALAPISKGVIEVKVAPVTVKE